MKQMLLLFFVSAVLCWACRQQPQQPGFNLEETVSADISAITEKDIQSRLPLLSEEDEKFAKTSFGRQNLIQVILREKLIAADALAQNIHNSAEYRNAIQEKQKQLTEIYQAYTRQLLEDLWYQKQYKTGTLNIPNEEIEAYYKK